jgi:hypothetical protein
VNLDLDHSRRRLAQAALAAAAAQPQTASGWVVFDAIGVTGLLTEPDGSPPFGLLDWCLVLESLGVGRRELDLIREVRLFLDVFDDGRGRARAAFAAWARNARAGTQARVLAVRRTAEDGSERWSTRGGPPELGGLPDVALDPAAATAVRDRDLVACASYAVGIGRGCLESARERAGSRVIAKRRLIEYQGAAHQLAESAVELAGARLAVWRSATLADEGRVPGYRATEAAAAAVTACLECAHTATQIFGAAGTSDPLLVWLHRTAYRLTAVCGSPRALWREAGQRALAEERSDETQRDEHG